MTNKYDFLSDDARAYLAEYSLEEITRSMRCSPTWKEYELRVSYEREAHNVFCKYTNEWLTSKETPDLYLVRGTREEKKFYAVNEEKSTRQYVLSRYYLKTVRMEDDYTSNSISMIDFYTSMHNVRIHNENEAIIREKLITSFSNGIRTILKTLTEEKYHESIDMLPEKHLYAEMGRVAGTLKELILPKSISMAKYRTKRVLSGLFDEFMEMGVHKTLALICGVIVLVGLVFGIPALSKVAFLVFVGVNVILAGLDIFN